MKHSFLAAVVATSVTLPASQVVSQPIFINNCAPTGMSLVEQADGSFAPTPVPFLPRLRPPTPKVQSPVEPTVVEGNLGKFLTPRGGSRERYEEASFSWEFSASRLAIPIFLRGPDGTLEMRTIYLGHTTHYDLCMFQINPVGGDDFEALCGDPDVLNKQRTPDQIEGIWLERVDCDQDSVAPNTGSGLAKGRIGWYEQDGFIPDYPLNFPSLLGLAWKLRACNLGSCSDWSTPRQLVWVPPPDLLKGEVTYRGPLGQLIFELLRVPTEDNLGSRLSDNEVEARICVAEPGGTCTAQIQDIPGTIWVRRTSVSGTQGNVTRFLDNDQNNLRTSVYWFLNSLNNWSGATCWTRKLDVPSNPDDPEASSREQYCVYQENYEIGDFKLKNGSPD